MNYLLPQEVTKLMVNEAITGLAAVPSLWVQLAGLDWPESAQQSLRYITSSGGTMPQQTLGMLRQKLPNTSIYLMYGLTEAFRSTYLPPEELDSRPTSMGKAIPHARLAVLRPDGTPCGPNEPGELVHSGPLVAKGYWNNPEKTARHFRPLPGPSPDEPETPAVWSGDTVNRDEDGYFYFIGREDDMIKTSGYRVSPTDIEEVILETGLAIETAVFGVPHPVLGQAIVAVAVASGKHPDSIRQACNKVLPVFMVPAHIEIRSEIPKTPHGKLDRKYLSQTMQNLFPGNRESSNEITRHP
jgi:acyl-CoA synthetase (AMP-forming)/AMP-acid ligase II